MSCRAFLRSGRLILLQYNAVPSDIPSLRLGLLSSYNQTKNNTLQGGQMHVAHSHCNIFMTHEGLHGWQVRTGHDQPTGKTVS
jgi:hypothetical protein